MNKKNSLKEKQL